MKKVLALTLAALLCTVALAAAQRGGQKNSGGGPPPIHNGLWWQSKSGLFRDGFMTGYKSGSEHASGHSIDINKFPAIELIDGLDTFYKDFRNRNILVDDALIYIVDQLRGTPDDKLNAELLKMRAAAAPSSDE